MGKKEGTQKKTTRVLLGNPCKVSCPPVSDAAEEIILAHLCRASEVCEGKSESGEGTLRGEFVFGLNAVSRAAAQGTLSAALVCRSLNLGTLSQHLSALCSRMGVPLLSHSQLSSTVAKMFDLSSLAAMGLKKSAASPSSFLHQLFLEICKGSSQLPQSSTLGSLESSRMTFTLPRVDRPHTAVAVNKETQAKSLENPSFILLNQHPVFPDLNYARDLETVKIRTHWSMEDLVNQQKPSEIKETPKRKYLIAAHTETVTSSFGKAKKKRRKLQHRAPH